MSRRVVITGIGVISPLGIGVGTFWDNLLGGKVGVRRIARYDPSGFPCRIAGEVPPFDIGELGKVYRKAAKVMARDIELALVAADGAFKDAGLHSRAYAKQPGFTPNFKPERFGCNIGAGLLSVDLNELTEAMHHARSAENPNRLDLERWGREGMGHLTPLWLLKYLPNMLACHVTIIHELKGPSNTITCADASSHLAIGEAFRTIQRGDSDLAICGGAETKVVPMNLLRQTLLKRVTLTHNDTPDEAVRPFDADADGTACAEGGGLFVLEEYEHARSRGAKVYAELAGFGASQDTYSLTEPDPKGHSYGKAIAKALDDAGVGPAAVGALVPCGLGIPSHDRAELAGLHQVFGGGLERVPLAPVKAQTGNLAAGSGADAAAAVLAVRHGVIPPARNTRKPLDGLRLNVGVEPRKADVNVAVSSVYSVGGQNAALVFRKVG